MSSGDFAVIKPLSNAFIPTWFQKWAVSRKSNFLICYTNEADSSEDEYYSLEYFYVIWELLKKALSIGIWINYNYKYTMYIMLDFLKFY